MILDLDIGNSSIKWRRLQSPDQVAIGQGRAEGLSDLKRTVADGGAIQRVRISCVRDSTFQESLQEWVQLNCQVDAEIAEVVREKAGLTVNYEDVSKLGVDRWLAMLAAFTSNDYTACTVIDCGTALTVDSIAGNGQHLGGFIVPGLELSRKALSEFTGIKMAAPGKLLRSGCGQLPDCRHLCCRPWAKFCHGRPSRNRKITNHHQHHRPNDGRR